MHSSSFLAALVAGASVHAISFPAKFSLAALSRRQPPQPDVVTNGYIAPPAAPELLPPVQAATSAAGSLLEAAASAAVPALQAAAPAIAPLVSGAPPPFPSLAPGAAPPPGVVPPGPPGPPGASAIPDTPPPGADPAAVPGADPAANPADPDHRPGIPKIPGIPGNPGKGNGKCPAVWTEVSKELTSQFLSGGQCNDLARGAIRAAFHDCGAWEMKLGNSAGCDGSLILAKEEIQRVENSGLKDIVPRLADIGKKFDVSTADFLQFAGAHAVKTCPLGPTVQTFVGRKDSSKPNPENLLPNPRSDGDTLVQLFQDKGISPAELTALIGAHTTAKQFAFDPSKSGAALDSSEGVWDVKFYGETIKRTAPFTLPSDKELAKQKSTGPVFKSFVDNQMGWGAAFAPAMTKLSLLGVDRSNLIDCTSALPGGGYRRATVKRRSW